MDSVSEEPAAAAAAAALRLLPVNLCVHYLLNRSFKKNRRCTAIYWQLFLLYQGVDLTLVNLCFFPPKNIQNSIYSIVNKTTLKADCFL